MLAAMFAAMAIQIGTNLHNDVTDFERGGDDPATRLGPPRATAEGWLTPDAVRRGARISFAAAAACGIYLVIVGGWPILLAVLGVSVVVLTLPWFKTVLMVVGILIGTWIGVKILSVIDDKTLMVVVGIAVIAFAVLQASHYRLHLADRAVTWPDG